MAGRRDKPLKRVRIGRIDEMIGLLEAIEPGQGSDYFRQQAIDYLKSYADTLDDLKTIKVKETDNA